MVVGLEGNNHVNPSEIELWLWQQMCCMKVPEAYLPQTLATPRDDTQGWCRRSRH